MLREFELFMSSPTGIAVLVWICVTLLVFALYLILKTQVRSVGSGKKLDKPEDMRLLLDKYSILRRISNLFAPVFDEIAPRFESGLYDRFKLAGRPRSIGTIATSRDVFSTFASVAVLASATAFVLALIMGVNIIGVFAISLAFGVLSYFGLSMWLEGEAATRQTRIDNEFPFYLDLGVMALGAGAKVEDTFDLYTTGRTETPLSEELKLVSGELNAGVPFLDAMQNFNGRTEALSVDLTVTEIVNSRDAGTPVSEVMNVAAKDLREMRTTNAEQMGEKLKSKIMLPSMMMAGSAMILILGPAFLEILNSDVF